MSRNGVPKRLLPIILDEAVHRLRFPLSPGEPITLHVCEFVERYETNLEQTKPARTMLTVRDVVESPRLLAPHLPLCPDPSEHERLPENQIDCVSCTFEFDADFFSTACYIVRVVASPTLITAELHLTAAPKLVGLVPMEIRWMHHFISSLGDGAAAYRQQNPHSPATANLEWAKKRGVNVVHFVENALDLAAMPLQELSVRSRMGGAGAKPPHQPPPSQAQTAAPGPAAQKAQTPPSRPPKAPPAAGPASPPTQPTQPSTAPPPSATNQPPHPQNPKIKRRG